MNMRDRPGSRTIASGCKIMIDHKIHGFRKLLTALAWTLFLMASGSIAHGHGPAELSVSSIFGDHMVLQRGMPVPVWGRAAAGAEVTVGFAGQRVSTTADAEGRWKLFLDKLAASSTPRELTIESTGRIVLKDVLVGEVWVCSGQSNMQFGWGDRSRPEFGWGGVEELAALADEAATLPIRSYFVPMNVSLKEEENCGGEWSKKATGSAVAFGFSYYLQKSLDVPVAVIVTCWGSSLIEGWMPLDMTGQLPHFKERMEAFEREDREKIEAKIAEGIRSDDVHARTRPNILYNAMMHPVIPYACRGMVWYQGEANSSKPKQYGVSLPLWVKRMRHAWQREDLHFLAVMLPGYGKGRTWPSFRDAQMKVLDLPHTAVANTIDLGHATAIHPSDKEPIAKRLSLLALRDLHGQDIMGQGPMMKSVTTTGDTMTVRFTHAKGLRTRDGEAPLAFEIAGQDGKWHPAQARIQGEAVALKSNQVPAPVHCRYAYKPKPKVNLINAEGLPAFPFLSR